MRKVGMYAFAMLFLLFISFLMARASLGVYPSLSSQLAPFSNRTITVPDDYPTIQAAINAASDGDTVFVRNGTYYEHLIINQSLTLIGEDRDLTVVDGSGSGEIAVIQADNVFIGNFTLQNGGIGAYGAVWVQGYSRAVISNNTMIDNDHGVCIWTGAPNVTISGNLIYNRQPSDADGIRLGFSSGNLLTGNVVINESTGIGLDWASNNIIQKNTVVNNSIGIGAVNASYNNVFSENTIANNSYGFLVAINNSRFFHNNIINNSIQAAFYGAYSNIWDNGFPSGGNYWSDYNGTDSCSGQYQNETGSDNIGDSPYVIDANNRDNYPLMHSYPYDRVQDLNTSLVYPSIQSAIDAPETLDGHTIFVRNGTYYENVVVDKQISLLGDNSNLTVLKGGISVGTNNVVIQGLKLVGPGTWAEIGTYSYGILTTAASDALSINNCIFERWVIGIMLDWGGGCEVVNNTLLNVDQGIWLDGSDNTILSNTIYANGWGISLGWEYQTGNLICGNTISGGLGLEINWFNSYNIIVANTFSGCVYGVHLGAYSEGYGPCSDNEIFHNNFINNTGQVYLGEGSIDVWDDGYPSGGNYWSDYNGADVYSGPYQNQTGSDGIGDTPYVIGSANQDNYPLMSPWDPPARALVGDLTGGTPNPWDFVPDGKVDGKDIAIVALCYGSAPGCPPPYVWNANCDVNGDGKIDGKDIAIVAIHYGQADS